MGMGQSSIVVYIKYQKDGHYHSLMIPNGSKLLDIEDIFMKLFTDLIPGQSKFSDFTFQLVHGETMVPIKNDYEFQPNDCLVASYRLTSIGGPVIPHPIEDGVAYYMWSMFSQTNEGLMKRDGTNVKCDGKKSDQPALIQFTGHNVTSSTSTTTEFAFTLASSNSNKVYVMKGENRDVIVEEVDKSFIKPSMGDEYKFECVESFSYMQYRCIGVGDPKRTDLYISVQQDGTVQLQKGGVLGYPTPTVLFIAVNMI
ncbi:uncharacterized protein LOC110235066 isoform X3 [Exaiptasia diaphana]|uniref:Uncharacterized protein n=1 Tax=Exaiptasia diaphana TaxID=2652724 RepID=A0A913WYN8_EXADI|nr:uncharacterized protein LOC110235066 isoform X3 [Exaiptasia diaphana]